MTEFKKAYLTAPEQDHLLQWLVASQKATYAHFIEWCDTNNIPEGRRWTQGSFRMWMRRRHLKLEAHQREYKAFIASGSVLDRPARITMLESGVARLTKLLEGENSESLSPDQMIRLEEQRRKLLQEVARERGEFGKPVDEDAPEARASTAQQATAYINFFDQAEKDKGKKGK